MVRRLSVTLGLLAWMTTTVSSGQMANQTGAQRPSPTLGRAVEGQVLIEGVAVDASASPLPNAPVRLRNLTTRRVEQVSTTNQLGQFTFIAAPDTPYVVELVDKTGRTIAVGDIITARSGDVAASSVVLPTRLPALAIAFADAATVIASAVASTGLAVVDPGPRLSPER